MKAQERLHAARKMADAGMHAQALDEFIWFHEHALDEQPSVGGVRLSFALSYWADLARVYPQAGLALAAIRDRKTADLLEHKGDRDTFHDVAAINRYLGCAQQTCDLFRQLAQSRQELARSCAHIARPSIIAAGDYALAERFMNDPFEQITERSDLLDWGLARRKRVRFSRAPQVAIEIKLYVTDVEELIAIVKGCGHLARARQLERFAVQSVKAPKIRDAVADALKIGGQRWFNRAIAAQTRRELRSRRIRRPAV